MEAAPRQHYNITLAALTAAGIAFALQQTMVIPALPALQREFDTSTGRITWLLTVFLLTASVLTPLLGKLGDQYGKERVLVISLAVFFLGSVGASLSWDLWSLVACRAFQGAGAAVFPLSFAIIRDEFPGEKIGVGIGVVSSVFGVGGGLGIVLSGVIVDNASWRWLFIVGALGMGIAVVLVHLFVPESPIKTPARLDLLGAALLSGGLVCALVALTEGERWGWTSGTTLGLAGGGVLLILVWAVVELRVAEPLVDMKMLGHRPVLMANLTGLIAGFAMFGSFILVPNFVSIPRGLPPELATLPNYGFGASATAAGFYLLPGALGGFIGGPLAGVLGRRYGSKMPLSLGMALAAAGAAILALWHDEPWQVIVAMAVLGTGIPFSFAAMAKIVVDAVQQSETGVASGMNTVVRTVGGVIGGQVGAAILTADTIGATDVPAESAFSTAFWLSAATATVGAVVALFVTARRGMVAPARAALETD